MEERSFINDIIGVRSMIGYIKKKGEILYCQMITRDGKHSHFPERKCLPEYPDYW